MFGIDKWLLWWDAMVHWYEDQQGGGGDLDLLWWMRYGNRP